MSNRNDEREQRERAQRNRYSTSGYGSDEGDYGSQQPDVSSLAGGRRDHSDRDIQNERGSRFGSEQRHASREGSYPQSAYRNPQSVESGYDSAQGGRGSAAGAGYGSESDRGFDDQDFSQGYGQGSSHFGSQGFGAQGSQGVYGPQGFGARQEQPGGYSREGYGARQYAQHGQAQQGSSGQWRASDTTGQGQSTQGSHRGKGPKNYTRSDERIREDLNERLTDSDEIDASSITVEVSNGVATLNGTVEQRWMKHRAEDLAEGCSGVRDVNNQIRVKSASGHQAFSQGVTSDQGSSSGSRSSTSGTGTSASNTSATHTVGPNSGPGAAGAPSGNPGGVAAGLGSNGSPGASAASRPGPSSST